jgi:hypothetical protein
MQPKPAPHPIRQRRNLLTIEGRGASEGGGASESRGASLALGRSSRFAIGAMYFGLVSVRVPSRGCENAASIDDPGFGLRAKGPEGEANARHAAHDAG